MKTLSPKTVTFWGLKGWDYKIWILASIMFPVDTELNSLHSSLTLFWLTQLILHPVYAITMRNPGLPMLHTLQTHPLRALHVPSSYHTSILLSPVSLACFLQKSGLITSKTSLPQTSNSILKVYFLAQTKTSEGR